jgi:hypothetical protein
MSIYATLAEIGIKRFGDENMIEILIQAVPPHIDDTGPQWDFLPPPVDPDDQTHRAVLFIERGTPKGTERCGQEYFKPLLTLTGREYETIPFADLLNRLEEALDRKYGPRPTAIFYGPDGPKRVL